MEVALFVRDENGCPSVPPDTSPELEAIMKDCWKYVVEHQRVLLVLYINASSHIRYTPDERASFEQLVTRLDQYHFKLKRHAPNLKPLGDGKVLLT